MVHQKKKPPAPQRSIWQTALGRVRAEIGMMARALVGLRGISQSSGHGPSAQTNPRARAGAAPIQAARKNMADASARPAAKIIPSGSGVARHSGAPPVSGTSLPIGSPLLEPGTIQPDTQSAPPAALPVQRLPATPSIQSGQRDGHARTPTPVADIDEAKPTAEPSSPKPPPPCAETLAPRPFRYNPTIRPAPINEPKPVLDAPNPDDDGAAPFM